MSRQEERIWSEALDERLGREMPRIYADPEKAKRLFRIAAFGLTLQERKLAVGEIAELKTVEAERVRER